MALSIEVIQNTRPPQFRWSQTVSTPVGDKVVHYEGTLPPSIEEAVASLIEEARRQQQEIVGLRRANDVLQSERDRLLEEVESLKPKSEESASPPDGTASATAPPKRRRA